MYDSIRVTTLRIWRWFVVKLFWSPSFPLQPSVAITAAFAFSILVFSLSSCFFASSWHLFFSSAFSRWFLFRSSFASSSFLFLFFFLHYVLELFEREHWRIQGRHRPAPQQDPIRSFSHVFAEKRTCRRSAPPPTGNPGSATGEISWYAGNVTGAHFPPIVTRAVVWATGCTFSLTRTFRDRRATTTVVINHSISTWRDRISSRG